MEYESYRSNYESSPWKTFTERNEPIHKVEDVARLCTSTQATSFQVIEEFLTHDKLRLDEQVPRRRQLLRDFLNEVLRPSTGGGISHFDDIESHSNDIDVALVDDRRKHEKCAKSIGSICNDCHIFSRVVTIPDLYRRLRESRESQKAEKRIMYAFLKELIGPRIWANNPRYIPNLTAAGALTLAATVARRSAVPVRNFLHKYLLGREHVFSASISSWGFFLEFHIPYHAMRRGRRNNIKDRRKVSGKRLRKSELLPLGPESSDQEELYYHQAQTSSLSWGPDEWFWTEIFLVDTYFGSEENRRTYFSNCNEGDGIDPPLGGRGSMAKPHFDPREYFLLKVDRRVEQVTTEYSALIETFDKRMEEYARDASRVFQDDDKGTYTRTLSSIIDTVHIFVDCISGIVDSWNTFNRTDISLFTRHAPGKPDWYKMIARIDRHITQLDGMRKLLINKRDRLKSKLDSLHTVSSLSQAESANQQTKTALSQGNDLKMLTKMTVYVAFPMLFTTAFFSMDFMKPKRPWAVFFPMLILTSLLNYMIASQRGPRTVWRDVREWTRTTFGNSGYIII